MRDRTFFAAVVLAFGFVATSPGIGLAEQATLTWSFRNNHQNRVQLEFYSQDRNSAWPGDGQAYVLDDYAVHTFRLNCVAGEKICYGAWIDGDSNTYWGVGIDDQYGCSDCCVTCDNADAGTRNLDP